MTKKKKCYYAVACCDALKAAAIFLDWRDCETFLSPKDNEDTPDYKVCNNLLDAVMFIEPFDDVEFNTMYMSLVRQKTKPASNSKHKDLQRSRRTSAANSGVGVESTAPALVPKRKRSAKEAFPTTTNNHESSNSRPNKQQRTTRSMLASRKTDQNNASEVNPADSMADDDNDSITNGKKDQEWEDKFNLLRQFYTQFQTCNVERNKREHEEKYPGLYEWVRENQEHLRNLEQAKSRHELAGANADPSDTCSDQELHQEGLLTLERMTRLKDYLSEEPKQKDDGTKTQDDRWERKYQMLLKYKEEYGTCGMITTKADKDYPGLRYWVKRQTQKLQEYKEDPTNVTGMDSNRLSRLEELGFTVDEADSTAKAKNINDSNKTEKKIKESNEALVAKRNSPKDKQGQDCLSLSMGEKWEQKFAMLQQFKTEFGHLSIPRNCERFPNLSSWLYNQRKAMQMYNLDPEKAKGMNPDRMKRLTELDVKPVEKKDDVWEEKFQMLKNYREEYDNVFVSVKRPEIQKKYPELGHWVRYQRRALKVYAKDPTKRPQLNPERVQRLSDLGIFETKDDVWDRKFRMLQNYKEEYGSLDVPAKAKDENEDICQKYPDLSNWVKYQRICLRYYMEDPTSAFGARLNADKVQRLNEIGIVEGLKTADEEWEQMFVQLQEFKEKHGHTTVPQKPRTPLRNWIDKQRWWYKKLQQGSQSRLNATQVARLVELGFQFTPPKRLTFNESAVKWLEYKTKTGNVDVSEEGPLKSWVQATRHEYQLLRKGLKSRLTDDQVNRLNEWGFKWSCNIRRSEKTAKPKPWEDRFQQLLQYKKEHGHMKVPQKYPELGNWVHKQRQNYRKFKEGGKTLITEEQIEKLKEVGFVFLTRKRPRKTTAAIKNTNADRTLQLAGSESDESDEYYSEYDQRTPQNIQTNFQGNFY